MNEYCMYLRKSRMDIEAEMKGEGETLARHQAMLIDLARKQKLNVTKVFKEIVSGDSIASRPQMQAMLAEITEGKYAGVLVVEIERLARGDTIDQGVVAQAFKQSDTKIITPIKTYDPSNEFDEEYFEFSLFMSRREYKTIKRRMQAGRLASVKEGNYIGNGTPYGYKKISPDSKVHTLEIVPEQAEIIKMIYNLYLSGRGAKFIASELNRMGIKPQKSEYWESPSIKKILSNPIYCGKIQWKTKSSGNTLYDGIHTAIIDEKTFNDVQYKMKNNPAAQLHPNDKLLNYYHGILYCKNCGHQMKRRMAEKTGNEHLLCIYRKCKGTVVSSSFKAVDEVLITAFCYRIEQLKEIVKNSKEKIQEEFVPDMKKPLIAEIEKLKKQQTKLYDLLEQEIYDTATFVERSKLIADKIKLAEQQLKEIEQNIPEPKMKPEKAISKLQYVVDNFSSANSEEKNEMLHRVVNKIYYSKSTRMCLNKHDSDLSLDIDFK